MTGRRHALNTVADLLGLPRHALRAVERRANGDFALVLRARAGSAVPRWAWSRRVFRIGERRVHGYTPRTPFVRPRDARARAKVNRWRFALWLAFRTDFDAPVARRALDGELEAVDELSAATLAACPPEPELVGVVFVFGYNGQAAA